MPFLIIGIVVFIYLILCFVVYMIIFFSRYKKDKDIYNIPSSPQYAKHHDLMIKLIDEFKGETCEDVYIKTFDGKRLHARYYKVSDDSIVDICFHGYRGTAIRDFCGGRKISYITKHNLLVVDQRGHGLSQGHHLTFGAKESKDVKYWIDYVNERFNNDVKIFLYGVSMGASTVLMAADMNYKNVKAIIADSPYTSGADIIRKVCNVDIKIPWFFVRHIIYLSAFIFGCFRLSKANVIKHVENASVPIMIIHSEDDKFIPVDMSRKLYESNKEHIVLKTFKDAGHGISYLEDKDNYEKEVISFIKRNE